jgi:hypothetical protein
VLGGKQNTNQICNKDDFFLRASHQAMFETRNHLDHLLEHALFPALPDLMSLAGTRF